MDGTRGKRDMRRISWPESDRERMTRNEFIAMRCLLGALSYAAKSQDDLQDRLQSVPGGRQRLAMAVGSLRAIADDLLGTMTLAQCKQIQNTMRDMEIQMVPKMTPRNHNVILQSETLGQLVRCAREKCRICTAMDEDIRKCELYKIFEAIAPLDSYGDGISCPYYLLDNWD